MALFFDILSLLTPDTAAQAIHYYDANFIGDLLKFAYLMQVEKKKPHDRLF